MRRPGTIDAEISNKLSVVLLNYFQREIRRMRRAADQAEEVERKLSMAFARWRHEHLNLYSQNLLDIFPSPLYSGERGRGEGAQVMCKLW